MKSFFFLEWKMCTTNLYRFYRSPCVLERESMSLHPTFVEYMDGARLYLELETDKDNVSIREVKIHFCDFIRIMIKNFTCK